MFLPRLWLPPPCACRQPASQTLEPTSWQVQIIAYTVAQQNSTFQTAVHGTSDEQEGKIS